jgi:hypothetical protein
MGGGGGGGKLAFSLRLAAAAIRLRLRLLQYFSLYGLQLQQSKQLQQCRLVASRTRPITLRTVVVRTGKSILKKREREQSNFTAFHIVAPITDPMIKAERCYPLAKHNKFFFCIRLFWLSHTACTETCKCVCLIAHITTQGR